MATLDLNDSLFDKMVATATIVALVSSSKITPGIVNEDLPAITYNKISDVPIHAMVSDSATHRPRYQISAWSTSFDQVNTIAKTIATALQDFQGTMTTSGVTVQKMIKENEIIIPEIDPDSKNMVYACHQDYIIWYTT